MKPPGQPPACGIERCATKLCVAGIGAVSPAGWGAAPLIDAFRTNLPLPTQELSRPGRGSPFRVRRVPLPSTRPAFLAHARLRRSSTISHYAVGAALEALGVQSASLVSGLGRLGIVMCLMGGCVNYSRRFYEEVLVDPAKASPLLFPETVFNAPVSHLATLLGATGPCYTLMGDQGTFLQGLALAADWLLSELVEGCLVVGAEELDWLSAEALRIFDPDVQLAEGAGALYLRAAGSPSDVYLSFVTDSCLHTNKRERLEAARKMRSGFPKGSASELLCDSTQERSRWNAAEVAAWEDWPGQRLSAKTVLGEGLAASPSWQCVGAIGSLHRGSGVAANVSVVGVNQQAIGARFERIIKPDGGASGAADKNRSDL